MFKLPKHWWDRFSSSIIKGQKPLYFRSPFKDISSWENVVDSVLHDMVKEKYSKRRLRIYLDDTRRNDIAKKFLDSEIPAEFKPFQWMQKVANSGELAFVINDFQDWTDPFSREIVNFLNGFYNCFGIPPGGVELIVFGGNYTGTPFGVHRGFEHAFLLHLGPGPKEFLVWSPELFQSLSGDLKDVFEYDFLLPHATTFTLRSGDLFYLPSEWFHIGMQDTYSCSIAIALYQPKLRNFYSIGLSRNPELDKPVPYLSALKTKNPLYKYLKSSKKNVNSFNLEMKSIADEAWYSLLSNGGLKRGEIVVKNPLAISYFSSIKILEPFKIYWQSFESENQIKIFVRQYSLKVPSHPSLIKIFKRLNKGESLSFKKIISLLSNQWTEEAIFGLFRFISQLGGIELVGPSYDLVDLDKNYAIKKNLSDWEAFVGKFLKEKVQNLNVPPNGYILELGVYKAKNFNLLCDWFGHERCLGLDIVNYNKHPNVIEKDVRDLTKKDDRPIALGWNDLSEWASSPASKMAGFKYLTRNIIVGGYYIDSAMIDNPFDMLSNLTFLHVDSFGCIKMFMRIK